MGSLLIVSLILVLPRNPSILLCTNSLRFTIFLTFDDTTGVNRLDRLTSGLMILATKASTGLAQEFIKGHVKKEYLARVRGKFPE
jgi:23S rRNA-/tRNA-specific pseudouridylate synthase